ncbi:MAG: heparinase II/III-family protein, partial [Opitutaceae bacterium]|nr:heparinase II/III-family protein [Opitutaceae bacterium]
AWIDLYASGYPQITPYESGILKGKLFGNFLNDATTLVQMCQAALLIWDRVPENKKEFWRRNYFLPEARLLDDGFACPINIACWQRAAQGLVALLYNDGALWKEVVDGKEGIRRQLGRGVTSDYFWFEQSLGYNYYVVDALLPFFEEAARRGRMEEIRDEAAILENLILAPLELRFPNGFLPNPADVTGRMQASRVRERLARVAHLFPTDVGCHAAGKIKDWAVLLNPPASPGDTDAAPPAFPEVKSRAFESTRFVVLKNDPWQVFVHFGQVDLNHAQAEAPGFEACHGKLPVTLDPGTVAYSSPLYKSYYKAGLADNVPLVNGLPQSTWRPGRLLAFDARENRAVVAQHPYVPGWNATREFHIDGEKLADRLTLEPDSPAPAPASAALGFLLHFENNASLATRGRAVLAGFAPEPGFATGRLEGFKNWSGVRRGEARDEARFALTIDGRRFDLVIRTEGAFSIHVAATPGYPPGRRTSLLVEKIAPKGVFETIISPASNK